MARSILVVEDEDIVATDIIESLEHFGYEVAGRAAAGEDAVSLARDEQPDLVLMDIKLEGEMDGVSAAAVIRESCSIPVVFLTAYADEETFERAKITEPYGYVLKPFKELELRTAIELALHKFDREKNRAPDLSEEIRVEAEVIEREEGAGAKTAEICAALRKIEPFNLLDESMLRIAANGCRLEEFESGHPIVFEGDQGDAGLVVVSGRVAMVKSSASGKELIVELLPPGDPFGLFAALDKQPSSVTLKAQVRSGVLWIPRSRLMLVLDMFPELSRRLVSEVFSRLRSAHDLSRSLAHDLVEVRVASALTALVPRFCREDKIQNGSVYVINMTRQELAEMIGSTSETVIRVTKAMERGGFLDLTQSGTIRILDIDGIKRLAEKE